MGTWIAPALQTTRQRGRVWACPGPREQDVPAASVGLRNPESMSAELEDLAAWRRVGGSNMDALRPVRGFGPDHIEQVSPPGRLRGGRATVRSRIGGLVADAAATGKLDRHFVYDKLSSLAAADLLPKWANRLPVEEGSTAHRAPRRQVRHRWHVRLRDLSPRDLRGAAAREPV